MEHIHHSYNMTLVIFSSFIAVMASYTALDLAGRVTASVGAARKLWLLGGAVAMGAGIWSMHFVAMLAMQLPIPVTYNFWIVLLSLLIAIASSLLALFVVSRTIVSLLSLVLGGLVMGGGIAAMHFTGMEAIRLQAVIRYDVGLFVLAVLVAVAASIAALWLSFSFRDDTKREWTTRKLGSSVIMGAAIVGMHYTGMSAAKLIPDGSVQISLEQSIATETIAYEVGIATLFMLGFTLISAIFDRRLASRTAELDASELHYRSLFDNNSDAVFSVDRTGSIRSVNPAVKRITGFDATYFIGQSIHQFDGSELPSYIRQFQETLRGNPQSFEMSLQHKHGHRVELEVTCVPISQVSTVIGVYFITKDVTEARAREARINALAYRDELTELPNRRKFIELVEESLRHTAGYKDMPSLCYLNIDRFKAVNDAAGNISGDEVLKLLASRMAESLPPGAILARLGSDLFTFLLPRSRGADYTLRTVKRLMAVVAKPIVVRGFEFHMSVSVGVALMHAHGEDGETLMKNAETALHYAKKVGRNNVQMYDASMDEDFKLKLEIESGLHRAIERREFVVHYQPQIDLASGEIVGAEALLRWNHPEKGLIPPGVFIPVAEETGLINPIGEWIIRTACQQNKLWQNAGLRPIVVSVNLSIRQFEQPHLAETIAHILEETGLEPRYLELEITESMAMDVQRALETLGRLKQLGLNISMDDFGTGYSSLSYLTKFPIDKLKIDQSFIREIRDDCSDAAIISTIVAMARQLQLKVIAEGVETEEQLAFLRSQQCDQIQGYYYSPPLPPEKLTAWIGGKEQAS
ncbi:MAG: EAL domain-containing protein [Paenibacillaceae bacterium]|nr:EAL domain-containing protein [Paenibacillaceae bacterium]